MDKQRNAAFSLRWFALAGVILGALVTVGPQAQAQSPSGALTAPSPQEQNQEETQSNLAAAGVVVSGSPLSASPAKEPKPEAARPQQGPISSSGVVGTPANDVAHMSDDPAAAGVVQ
jgi:hypothetical protein